MAFSLRSKKSLVGLDIGSHTIKLCSLKMGNRGPALLDFGMLRLPLDQDFLDPAAHKELIARYIRTLLDNLKLSPREVATSISGFSVIIKQLSLPYPTKKDLLANIQWEAEQHIPFGVQDVTMDVHVVGRNRDKEDHTDVILVAAKNEHVQAIVDLLRMARLSAGVIDVDMFALENAYEVNYPYEEGCIALIDIGASQLKINVLRDGISVFTREVSQGGSLINQKIQRHFNVGAVEAEHIKLFAKAPQGREAGLRQIFEEAAVAWSLEIKRAFDFVISSNEEIRIQKILLAGGCALTPGFSDFLKGRVGVPVELFDPFLGIACDPKRLDPDYLHSVAPLAAVSVGLALRKVADS